MPLISTPAIILSTIRYGDTSKIVRLATRELGVQSVIAKGALRPRSKFGAALQVLSDGQAHLIYSDRKDLHLLTGFDLTRLRIGLTEDLDRYTAAFALAELMLRFAQPEPQPELFDLLQASLEGLEKAPPASVQAIGLRELWRLVCALGFAPALDACVRDGEAIPPEGDLVFSTSEGGALCRACAATVGGARLGQADRAVLESLIAGTDNPPALGDDRSAAAHRRLFVRYLRHHVGGDAELPALEFWQQRPWDAR